jgi:hypothetical protein
VDAVGKKIKKTLVLSLLLLYTSGNTTLIWAADGGHVDDVDIN